MGTYVDYERSLEHLEQDFPDRVEKLKSEFQERVLTMLPVTEDHLREQCRGDEQLERLFEEMLEHIYRYTADVWSQTAEKSGGLVDNLERIREIDQMRTAAHNAMIDSVRILARNLNNRGKDGKWIQNLENKGRAAYATFAVWTTALDILRKERENG